jgi:hypothetical protein
VAETGTLVLYCFNLSKQWCLSEMHGFAQQLPQMEKLSGIDLFLFSFIKIVQLLPGHGHTVAYTIQFILLCWLSVDLRRW